MTEKSPSPNPNPVPKSKFASPAVKAAPATRPRMVITETVTHVPPRGEPTSISVGVGRFCRSDEMPYRRPGGSFVVGLSWKVIDLGWLAEDPTRVGPVVIYNTEGVGLEKIPTPEERAAIDRRVVEVAVTDRGSEPVPAFLILPGDVFRGLPAVAGRVVVRCADPDQQVRCDLIVFPG